MLITLNDHDRELSLFLIQLDTTSLDASIKQKKLAITAADTLIWQALASVIIPGLTINRTCALSLRMLQRYSNLPIKAQKWTTAIGLGCIPAIVKPIDHSVDYVLDNTIRKLY